MTAAVLPVSCLGRPKKPCVMVATASITKIVICFTKSSKQKQQTGYTQIVWGDCTRVKLGYLGAPL